MEKGLLGRLEIESAIQREAASPPFLLPSRHVEDALGGRLAGFAPVHGDTSIEALAKYCRGVYRRDQQLHSVEVVSALKSPKGHRPVHILSFEQRVLYRALVQALETPPLSADRSDEAWLEFQNGPLEQDDYRYIVRTDIVGAINTWIMSYY